MTVKTVLVKRTALTAVSETSFRAIDEQDECHGDCPKKRRRLWRAMANFDVTELANIIGTLHRKPVADLEAVVGVPIQDGRLIEEGIQAKES